MTSSTDRGGKSTEGWRDRLAHVIEQDPLIVSKPSRGAVAALDESPQTIFMGVGLCTRVALSQALPIDVLGMLLPAEALRRAVAARQILVLVADAHAMTNHLSADAVERRARLTVQTVARVARRLGLERLVVVRASWLARQDGFQQTLSGIRNVAEGDYHPYVLQQVADVAYVRRTFGSMLKVGWTFGARGQHGNDETTFDRIVEPLTAVTVAYVYGWPGRALDDRQSRAAPYVALEPSRRLIFHGREDVGRKLACAQRTSSAGTIRAVRNHLRRLTAGYARVIAPLQGASVEERVQMILERVYRPGAADLKADRAGTDR